jgi:hypothetical protein
MDIIVPVAVTDLGPPKASRPVSQSNKCPSAAGASSQRIHAENVCEVPELIALEMEIAVVELLNDVLHRPSDCSKFQVQLEIVPWLP